MGVPFRMIFWSTWLRFKVSTYLGMQAVSQSILGYPRTSQRSTTPAFSPALYFP